MLQVEFLVTLLDNSDGNAKRPASRTIFLKKFKRFIQENVESNRVSTNIVKPAKHELLYTESCFRSVFLQIIINTSDSATNHGMLFSSTSGCVQSSVGYRCKDTFRLHTLQVKENPELLHTYF